MAGALKFTPDELREKIAMYFSDIDEQNIQAKLFDERPRPYTVSGLCVFLGIFRETLLDYGKRPDTAEIVKMAKYKVETCIEEGSLTGRWNVIGSIFNLKNNFGWVDKFDVSTTVQPEQLNAVEIKRLLQGKD